MFQGNWKCSACGGVISELPFQPKSESGLTCRTCWSKSKGINTTSAPQAIPSSSEIPDDIPFDADVANEPMSSDDGFEDATPITPGEKKRFEGDWGCAGCGASITSLPFNPRETNNLKCIDCFKASRK